jgi:hypothetical protein
MKKFCKITATRRLPQINEEGPEGMALAGSFRVTNIAPEAYNAWNSRWLEPQVE